MDGSLARLYDHLFLKPDPDDLEPGKHWFSNLNPDSLEVTTCCVEPSVVGAQPGARYQFERVGYFCVDKDSTADKLVSSLQSPGMELRQCANRTH